MQNAERSLMADLKSIFKVKDISFDQPSSMKEQEKLFIEIENSVDNVKDKKYITRLSGNAIIFASNEKLPIGFISKAIKQADKDLTRKFFFSGFESNTKLTGNIVQRGFSFVYFFNEQYDPEQGSITSIEFDDED